MPLPIEIIPDEELGGFTALVPGIPGCGEGETEAEAIEDLKDALRLCVEVRGIAKVRSLVQSRPDLRQSHFELDDLMGK